MSAITTSSSLPAPIQQKFTAKLLSTQQQYNVHNMFADQYEMTDNDGVIMRMRRYQRLQTAPVPLGTTFNNPPAQQLNAVDLDARIDWYSTYVILTRQVTMTNQDAVLNEAAARLGQSMRETEDELTREVLLGGASLLNCVSGTNGRNVAVTKSLLIELELSACNDGDNNAQAIGNILCAA